MWEVMEIEPRPLVEKYGNYEMHFFPYQAHYHPLSTPTMLTLFSSIYDVGTVGAVLSTINTNIYLNQYHPPSSLSVGS